MPHQNAHTAACPYKLPGDVASNEARGARYKRGHKIRNTSS